MRKTRTQLVAHSVRFLSECDEEAFFCWLKQLDCVEGFHGQGLDLFISVSENPLKDESLRELLALFSRYRVDMTQLACFENDANRSWFRDARAYWFRDVFGGRPV